MLLIATFKHFCKWCVNVLFLFSFRYPLEKRLWAYFLLHRQWGRHLGICFKFWIHHWVGCPARSTGHICWTCKNTLIQIMKTVQQDSDRAEDTFESKLKHEHGRSWEVVGSEVLLRKPHLRNHDGLFSLQHNANLEPPAQTCTAAPSATLQVTGQ